MYSALNDLLAIASTGILLGGVVFLLAPEAPIARKAAAWFCLAWAFLLVSAR